MVINSIKCGCGKVHWEINPYVKCKVGGRRLKRKRLLKKRIKWEQKYFRRPYQIGCAVDWLLKRSINNKSWDCVTRAFSVLEDHFKKKYEGIRNDNL
jgi:hypothetical protein